MSIVQQLFASTWLVINVLVIKLPKLVDLSFRIVHTKLQLYIATARNTTCYSREINCWRSDKQQKIFTWPGCAAWKWESAEEMHNLEIQFQKIVQVVWKLLQNDSSCRTK